MKRYQGTMRVLGCIAAVIMAAGLAACSKTNRVVSDFMFFRAVECTIPAYSGQPSAGSVPPSSGSVSQSVCDSRDAATLPSTPPGGDFATATVILPYFYGTERFVLGPSDLGPSGVTKASAATAPGGGYQVRIFLTHIAANSFNNGLFDRSVSEGSNAPANVEAFDVNGTVVSTGDFKASNDSVVITGPAASPFTKNQADSLAARITSMARAGKSS